MWPLCGKSTQLLPHMLLISSLQISRKVEEKYKCFLPSLLFTIIEKHFYWRFHQNKVKHFFLVIVSNFRKKIIHISTKQLIQNYIFPIFLLTLEIFSFNVCISFLEINKLKKKIMNLRNLFWTSSDKHSI